MNEWVSWIIYSILLWSTVLTGRMFLSFYELVATEILKYICIYIKHWGLKMKLKQMGKRNTVVLSRALWSHQISRAPSQAHRVFYILCFITFLLFYYMFYLFKKIKINPWTLSPCSLFLFFPHHNTAERMTVIQGN